jgi:mono/diheme cytochrome c family protein
MKKSVIAVVAVVAALIYITAVSFKPVRAPEAPKSIPDSVYAVFSKSCIGCHADDGNGMAKSKVNFDKWDSYSPEKQASKAAAISKMLNKGAMPPSGFRKSNPTLIPTEADVAKVTAWAKSF